MSDSNSQELINGGRAANDASRPVDENRDLSATAKAQIANRQAHEKVMDAHVQHWKAQHQKLANMSYQIPEFNMSDQGHRNLLNDYRDKKAGWDRKADVIDEKFSVNRENIRGLGKTLQHEFSVPHQSQSRSKTR